MRSSHNGLSVRGAARSPRSRRSLEHVGSGELLNGVSDMDRLLNMLREEAERVGGCRHHSVTGSLAGTGVCLKLMADVFVCAAIVLEEELITPSFAVASRAFTKAVAGLVRRLSLYPCGVLSSECLWLCWSTECSVGDID
ncbi:hypothetical protein EGW08_010333 [Elysia chlorotica]|uniref:Uncharacterized protein n=1 Tax=Elysia chlorotica TaxID=188477 RepID=A0A3S1C3G3_ELYCH|nr:hypothetical protein EGW08_010333 [Elysia chlorotica]